MEKKFFKVTAMTHCVDRTDLYLADSIGDIIPIVDEQITCFEKAGVACFQAWESYENTLIRRSSDATANVYAFQIREILPITLTNRHGVQCILL